jgi:hypothetical protein
MKTIRAIFRDGTLNTLDPVELPENTPLTLALLDPDDLAAEAIAELADKGKSFERGVRTLEEMPAPTFARCSRQRRTCVLLIH